MPYVLSWPAGTLTNREFYAGDLALLTNGDPGDYEVVEIEAVTSSSITLAQIPMKPWPVGTRIIPLRQVHLDELPTRSAPTSHVATMSVRFEFDEPERNITPSWGGPEQLFSFPTNWANAPDLGYERTNYTMDTQTGVIEIIDPADVGRVTMRGNVSLFGRARVAAFRAFAAQARGRAQRFWCATGTHDLEPLGEIGGAARLDVAPVGYASLFNVPQDARRSLVIYLNDGSAPIYREILNVEARSGFDRMTLNASIPEITRDQIDRVSFLMPVRFDQDSFEVEHVTDNLTAVRTSVTVRSTEDGGLSVPGQVVIQPILLDTFTAADGTDPTARDLDVHPAVAGMSRWAGFGSGTSNGVVYNNSLINASSDYSTTVGVFIYCYPDSGDPFITGSEYAAFMEVQTVSGGRAAAFQAYAAGGQNLQFSVQHNQCSVIVEDGTSSWIGGTLPSTIGTVKVCAHVSGAGVLSLAFNGSVVATSAGVNMPSGINYVIANLGSTGSATYQNDTAIRSVAMYQGITLSEAIALTA